jgi:Asp-tRNA(Asn)/Glu-tRNA(Gln) amidotransferase C subunit
LILRFLTQNSCSYSECGPISLTIIGVSSDSSPVDPEVVRHVAALARLRVADGELPGLTRQLARILSYIDQFERDPGGAAAAAGSLFRNARLREDSSVRAAA